jgi:hypothetical protein
LGGFFWTLLVNTLFFDQVRENSGLYFFITKLDFFIAALLSGAFVAFAIHFPKENSKIGKIYELAIISPTILFAFLSFSEKVVMFPIIGKTNSASWFGIYISIISIYYILITGSVLLFKFRKSSGIQKNQLGYFLSGYLIAIGILLFNSFYVNSIGDINRYFDRFTTNAGILFITFSAYAVLKYRFLDLGLVIQRGATRILSFLVIFCLYLIGLLLARDELVARSNDLTAIIIVALVVAVTIEPLRKFVFRFVDRAFASHDEKAARAQKRVMILLKSQQSYDGLLTEIQSVFKEFAEVDEVEFVESTDSFFAKRRGTYEFLRATGRLIIPEELPYRFSEDDRFAIIAEELQDTKKSCIMAIGQSSSFIGVLTLGQRKNMKAYSAQDIGELKRLQMQFGLALFNARLYKQAVERITK